MTAQRAFYLVHFRITVDDSIVRFADWTFLLVGGHKQSPQVVYAKCSQCGGFGFVGDEWEGGKDVGEFGFGQSVQVRNK